MYIVFIKDHTNGAKGMKKGCVRDVPNALGKILITDDFAEESTEEDYNKFIQEYYIVNKKPSRPGGYLTKKTKRKLTEEELEAKANMQASAEVRSMEKKLESVDKVVKSKKQEVSTLEADAKRVKLSGSKDQSAVARLKIVKRELKDFEKKRKSIGELLQNLIETKGDDAEAHAKEEDSNRVEAEILELHTELLEAKRLEDEADAGFKAAKEAMKIKEDANTKKAYDLETKKVSAAKEGREAVQSMINDAFEAIKDEDLKERILAKIKE